MTATRDVAKSGPCGTGTFRALCGARRQHGCRRGPPRPHHAPGYTLLELLLVLAIVLAVAGAVAPTVVERMAEYRLKEGAECARAALSATRVHAIDLSSVYQFRFEPGGRRFLAVPTDADALTMAASGSTAAGGFPRGSVESGQLPEELSFQAVAPATAGAATPAAAATELPVGATDTAWSAAVAHVSNAGELTSAVWSAPIVFRPDGTAADGTVNIVDQHGDGYQLKVRELTGEVSVTRL